MFTSEIGGLLALLEGKIRSSTEVTMEVNPNNLKPENFSYWTSVGINRFSVGVQSFQPKALKLLTRDHGAEQTDKALQILQRSEANWSLDLIYGWHDQTLTDWKEDLERALSYKPAHVSIYNLTYEPGTPYYLREQRGVLKKSPQEIEANMYQLACQTLSANGYDHYELASWCRPGKKSRHNSKYWDLMSCVAVGSGAHGFRLDASSSFSPGVRYSYPKNLKSYMNSWQEPLLEEGRRLLDLVLEYGLVRLRTRKGLSLADLEQLAGSRLSQKLWSALTKNTKMGLHTSESHLVLPEDQWILENAYLREFHSCLEKAFKDDR